MTELDRLNCNNIPCHQGLDILDSVYAAMSQLPCNGVQGILCAVAQEIQALRDLLTEVEPHLDEWNFPITLQDRVREAIKKHE